MDKATEQQITALTAQVEALANENRELRKLTQLHGHALAELGLNILPELSPTNPLHGSQYARKRAAYSSNVARVIGKYVEPNEGSVDAILANIEKARDEAIINRSAPVDAHADTREEREGIYKDAGFGMAWGAR